MKKVSKWRYITACVCSICVAVISVVTILKGFDTGVGLASVSAVSAIAGWALGRKI